MAAMAFTNAGLTMAHGVARAIASRVQVQHGRIMATLLAPEMRYNSRLVPDRFGSLARQTGFADVESLISRADELRGMFNLPATLKDLGVRHEDLDWISRNSGPMRANPIRPTEKQLLTFLEEIHTSL